MVKTDRSVVRNQAYKKSEFSIRERHNERLNETYYNSDIQSDRQHLNVYFKQNEGSYTETFEKMLTDGTISTRGLKSDAKVFDEFVFDVNTEYFDRNGGYEYAKSFFEEAYHHAVEEIGGEQYVLSAVMHADERNKALSEKLGRDVYHYHLHVVYVPVVDKKVLWTKRCKDPALVGTLKEVIKQVSHSKKWPRLKTEKGWINSYSLLQDRFHDHMKNAGFVGFERGERGSTNEHLSVVEYKTQQEMERAAVITAVVEEKRETASELDKVIGSKEQTAAELDTAITKKTGKFAAIDKSVRMKQEKLKDLTEKTSVVENEYAQLEEIEKLGHKRTITGAVTVPSKMWDKILNLIKEVFKSRRTIADYRKQNSENAWKISDLEKKLKAKEEEKPRITDTMEYAMAKSRAPRRMAEIIADIMRKPSEYDQQRQEHTAITKKKNNTHEH